MIMYKNIIDTSPPGERVSSSYAEIYLDDNVKDVKGHQQEKLEQEEKNVEYTLKKTLGKTLDCDPWISPSDQLIGVVELVPPFTSKITRGKTHAGILAIGNNECEKERAEFLRSINKTLHDNVLAWHTILRHEENVVLEKVKTIYDRVYETKSKIMSEEILKFYEKTLQELEEHIKLEVKNVLISAHANMIHDLNINITQNLVKEKAILEKNLEQKYKTEIKKVKRYYSLLLKNEINRNAHLVHRAAYERNDAIRDFLKLIDADNITSTMYVMCAERKRCKIKNFILEGYQTSELQEKLKKLKEKQDIITMFKEKEIPLFEINRDWEMKIKKILSLFLKFISFSLKLLPEQATFLLDLQKMVVLQLNEMQRIPNNTFSILKDKLEVSNVFKFEDVQPDETICNSKPFVIVGDLADPEPIIYGSRETLASDVDLPVIRVNRKYVYARCHGYENITKIITPLLRKLSSDTESCGCPEKKADLKHSDTGLSLTSPTESTLSYISESSSSSSHISMTTTTSDTVTRSSSDELLFVEDINRLNKCPARACKHWVDKLSFPHLNEYLEFTEKKYARVQAILGDVKIKGPLPEPFHPRTRVHRDLPFDITHEPYHHVQTQYSIESLTVDVGCTCGKPLVKIESNNSAGPPTENKLADAMKKRKLSLRYLMKDHPYLVKIFTDEDYDFIY